MFALSNTLTIDGKLEDVVINGPSPRVGAQFGGMGGIGGAVIKIGGGGGPPVQLPPPTTGPVRILVAIRPPIVLPSPLCRRMVPADGHVRWGGRERAPRKTRTRDDGREQVFGRGAAHCGHC
jgi:hypothetical protein